MKSLKRFFVVLLTAVLTFSFVIPVQAASGEYAYKVRIFAGKQGLLNGGASVEKGGIVGDSITFRQAQVQDSNAGYVSVAGTEYAITLPADSRYYVKGIKISGSETMSNAFSAVEKDMDYVVVYGMKGAQVTYTVRYCDRDGNPLFDDEHYVGNIGDKPIVAYRYLEGYVPQANNLTKTLSANEAENIFTFYYSPAETGGGTDNTIITEEVVTGTNVISVVVPGEEAEAEEPGGVEVVPGGDAGEDAGAAGGEDAGGDEPLVEVPDEQVPQDLVDLDEEEDVPLANNVLPGVDAEGSSIFLNLPPAAIIGIVSAAVLAVAAAWYLLFGRRKKNAAAETKAVVEKKEKRER